MPEVNLTTFTVADLKSWLLHNQPKKGLSEEVIDPVRAFAIVHSPFAENDMPVVSALYVGDDLAAYTAVIPERLQYPQENTIYWFSTLYCKPQYEGRGYGLCVVAQLFELLGEDNCFDLEGAPETVEILKYLGLKIEYVPQYVLAQKRTHTNSVKGRLAALKNSLELSLKNRGKQLIMEVSQKNYELQYVSFIDDLTYSFIQNHAKKDVFLRKQEMLNWMLKHYLYQPSRLMNRTKKTCQFSSAIEHFEMQGVKVYVDGILVGFYVLCFAPFYMSVKYLYFDEKYENEVFCSVGEHLLRGKFSTFKTASKPLHDFVEKYHLFSKSFINKKSFAFPESFDYSSGRMMQEGDGDNLTND